MLRIAELILPLPLQNTFSYVFDTEEMDPKLGARVIVEFGKSKLYTAIVFDIHDNFPEFELKPIFEILDTVPLLKPKHLNMWQWMSHYYCCSLGEVMAAALPSDLNIDSQSIFSLRSETPPPTKIKNDRSFQIYQALLLKKELSLKEIQKLLGVKRVGQYLNSLKQEGLIQKSEVLDGGYKEKTVKVYSLAFDFSGPNGKAELEAKIESTFQDLSRAKKQQMAFSKFLEFYTGEPLSKIELLKDAAFSSTHLKALVQKKILLESEVPISRIRSWDGINEKDFKLNQAQAKVLEAISKSFKSKSLAILQGVTGSGKTQVYIELIREQLRAGKQCLYLLPEIALTEQIVNRLKHHFPEQLLLFHSRISQGERTEIWKKVSQAEPLILLAARSGIFLPFHSLSLIIVDEEHDSSYKQFDPAPRYSARDVALYLGASSSTKILLGSATPSLSTWSKRNEDAYAIFYLNERFNQRKAPKIEIVDMDLQRKQKRIKGAFSDVLLEAMETCLEKKEQIILFQNRRGYAPISQCKSCSTFVECPNCDVSLTFHKPDQKLKCHYCGFNQKPSRVCRQCGENRFEIRGSGTQQIEEELGSIFPKVKVARLDFDSSRGSKNLRNILQQFKAGESEILVGTQMVTKGLDFSNVTLVGLINTDQLVHFPHFRAGERAIQMITQVAGRSGRSEKVGRVILQTFKSKHPIYQNINNLSLDNLYEIELEERRQFKFPPFYKIIEIQTRHPQLDVCWQASQYLKQLLEPNLGNMLDGPFDPMIKRMKRSYIQVLMLKFDPNTISASKLKALILKAVPILKGKQAFAQVRVVVDVDPN